MLTHSHQRLKNFENVDTYSLRVQNILNKIILAYDADKELSITEKARKKTKIITEATKHFIYGLQYGL